jgi:hypothetical protein
MGKEDCRWLEVGEKRKGGSDRAKGVKELEVSAEQRVATLLRLLKVIGIRKDKIVAANHNGKGPTSVDIFPNASIETHRLPVIHIESGRKGRLKYSMSSLIPADPGRIPTDDDPSVLSPARGLQLPCMEGTRIGLNLKTHLNPNGDKFVYCLDGETGIFRIALPRHKHKKNGVEIGGELVIGLEFRPRINDHDAQPLGRVLFLGPPR